MGNSEKLLGSLIKDSKEKIIISTKYAPNKKNQKSRWENPFQIALRG